MNKLEQIVSFINVVEANSFAAAARKLNLSTAAVSRKITSLEKKLGVQLLQRSTRHLALTALGEQYYQHCKNLLEQLHMMDNQITASQQAVTGTLHVVSNRYFAMQHIMPRLPQFMFENPALRIKLEIAERFPNMAQEGIDILFGISIEGPPELVHKRICNTRYVLCASPAYLQQFGTPQAPNDLLQHRYIAHHIRKPLDTLLFKDGKEMYIEPYLSLNDASAMLECALLGLGIIKLHDYIVADALKAGQLIEILTAYQTPHYPVYLYYQQTRYLLPKIRRFIDFFTHVES